MTIAERIRMLLRRRTKAELMDALSDFSSAELGELLEQAYAGEREELAARLSAYE